MALHDVNIVQQLINALTPVEKETIATSLAIGRVLAGELVADRDSPAHDVSAMDGYAVRLNDLVRPELPVHGEVKTGQAPPAMKEQGAYRIFTGGCVPAEAEAIIKREDVDELAGHICLQVDPANIKLGQHIRRQGENIQQGQTMLTAGQLVSSTTLGAAASIGQEAMNVYRRVRVGLLTTGDELRPVHEEVQPWQIRNSNGPALQGLLDSVPWLDVVTQRHVKDEPDALQSELKELSQGCDAVLLTGGVSMGDHDYVPGCVQAVGAEVVFHKLAIRPGKPLLGALGPQGQAIFGLPGNPVSALITARRFAVQALRKLAGFINPQEVPVAIHLEQTDEKTLPLTWYRLVHQHASGQYALTQNQGSGDLVAAAQSAGFVEILPDHLTQGWLTYYPWQVSG